MRKKLDTIFSLFLLLVLGASSIMEQENKLLLSAKVVALVIIAGMLGWIILSTPSPKTIAKSDKKDSDNA